MRTLAFAALLAVSVVSPAVAHDATGRMISRLLPEPRPEGQEPPAYLDEADIAAFDLAGSRYKRVIWSKQADPLVRAEALAALGNYDAAVALLDDEESVTSLVLLGKIERNRLHFAASADAFQRAIEQDSRSFAARSGLGMTLEAAGDVEAAVEAYRWFDDNDVLRNFYANQEAYEDADELVAAAVAMDRLATITFAYRDVPDLHDDVLGMLVYAYDTIDRGNADARTAAASFLYSRSDLAAALEELQVAATARPFDHDSLALFGRIHLDRYGFDKAAAVIDQLRRVDPASRTANLLEARSLLLQRQPERARPAIDRLLAVNPNDIEALGSLAAVHAMRLDFEASDAVLAQVEALDSDDTRAHFIVGEQLAIRRQYDRAADVLGLVVQRAPWWTQGRNELGKLLVQAGREAEAIAQLTAAAQLDPFDANIANYLALLNELSAFERRATEHFVVRHDADHPADGLVGEVMAGWLDGMHADVAGEYGWEPDIPTDIQIFPTHDRFSVRVAGDPYVGTVGACTGPVIALVAPADRSETLGSFDWARVMRHEYVHTITLGATGNRVWHWLTEGLAVRGELSPPSQEQLSLLSTATLTGGLFGIEDLTWGFVRPQKPTDRSQAYAQSWMVTEYLAERYGERAPYDVLEASGRGLTEREALAELYDLTPADFDAAFAVWMSDKVAAWGHDAASSINYKKHVTAGEAAVRQRDWPAAIEAYEAAQQDRPLDEGPMRRLAALYSLTERKADAAELFWELSARTTSDARFAMQAAKLWLELGDKRALDAATRAMHGNTYDRETHELLLQAAEAVGDDALVERQQAVLRTLDGLAVE